MTFKTHLISICSFLIDFSIIYLFVRALKLITSSLGFNNEVLIYLCVCLLYSIFSATNKGKSVGREFMQIQIANKNIEYSKIKIFTHDFFYQWGIFFILPMSVFQYFIPINILILLVIFLVINTLSWLIFRINIVELFSNTKIRKKTNFHDKNKITFVLFLSWIIDLTIVFSITLLVEFFLFQWIFIKYIFIFLIVSCLYYLASYIIANKTFGKFFFGISISLKSKKTMPLEAVLKRELLFKFGLSFLIPLLLMIALGWNDVNMLMIFITIFNIIIAIVYYSCKKELWWNKFANTKYTRKNLSKKNVLIKYAVLLFFLGFVYVNILVNNNYENNTTQNFLGFNFPFKKNGYPNNTNVKTYIDFLSINKLQNPKNYILSLFEKNDIVILCESNHLEDTQWDLIYSVVRDSLFINKIGNVFTEYGNTKNQSKVTTFLRTNYQNDTMLQKSAATLMNYHGGNFYRFITKLNKLNTSLSDSLKINLFFTDIMPWSYLIYDKPPIEQLLIRDSLMASVVVDWYKKTKKKCLIITNYRHAFAVNKKAIERKRFFSNCSIWQEFFFENEAQYIYNNFPDKTSNVMIYGDANNFLNLAIPIQNGKWRTAFKSSSRPVGFNFDESPFGEDSFDFYPTKARNMNLKYKDVFTGFVFYRAKEKNRFSSQLYSKYAAQKEYNEIINHKNIDTILLKERIEKYKDFYLDENNILLDIYLNWYYYIDIILFIIFTFFILLILIFDLLFLNQNTEMPRIG
ncbi:MAG: hypothetical protein IMY72_12610 [Bacteroidetes bacterium]|nr:hypothetical protein [Bacteroidota bacterium]